MQVDFYKVSLTISKKCLKDRNFHGKYCNRTLGASMDSIVRGN